MHKRSRRERSARLRAAGKPVQLDERPRTLALLRRMKLRRSMALALGTLAVPAIAAAQPRGRLDGRLRVTPSSDGCVTEAALEPRVRRWLDAPAPRGDIEVAVHADAQPVAFDVLRGGDVIAERRFDVLPADCGDRLDAIAVAIAVAIEHATSARADTAAAGSGAAAGAGAGASAGAPAGAEGGAPGQPPRPAADGAQGEPPETPPAEPAAEPEQDEAARAPDEAPDSAAEPAASGDEADAPNATVTSATRLSAAGMLLFQVLPETAFAIGVGGELQRSALRLGAGALITAETDTEFGVGRARTRLLAARAHGCLGGVPLSELDVEACAGVAGGVVLAAGDDFPSEGDAAMGWLAGVLRAAVRYPESPPISLRLALDGLLSISRPELVTKAPTRTTSARGVLGAAASLELVIALP